MEHLILNSKNKKRMTLGMLSTPAKALVTCIIMTMSFGMLGAVGQIVVHDIIPTFFSKNDAGAMSSNKTDYGTESDTVSKSESTPERGDLLSELTPADTKTEKKPFYLTEQFVWTLKWTHIHLFGINMIFIFMGIISLFLDVSTKFRTWLIVLPFIGVMIDILAVWLKGYVSPAFFWLHTPGGGIFTTVFWYVSLRSLWEMWLRPVPE